MALHEWKWGLVCEKRAMPHHSCSGVILEDFWEVVWFVLQVLGRVEARETYAQWEEDDEEKKKKDTSNACGAKMNHSQGIKIKMNLKLNTSDK